MKLPSFHTRIGSALVLLVVVAAAITGFVILTLGQTRDIILRKEAETTAMRWISYFSRDVPDLDTAFGLAKLTQDQIDQIARAQLFGDVFRFKMFDTSGRLFFISDTGAFAMVADVEGKAIETINTGKPIVSLEDGSQDITRPHRYAEAYAPVYASTGALIGAMEVYVDLTATHVVLMAGFRKLLFGLPLLCGLAYLIPAVGYLVVQRQNRNRAKQLHQIRYDPLTGVLDRRHFEADARDLLTTLHKEGHTLGVIFMDVDHFKSVNDSVGHAGGDAYLRFLTNAIMSRVRPGDMIGRLGGDEFVVLIPGLDSDGLHQRADDFCKVVQQQFIYRGEAFTGSMSMGTYLARPGATLKFALDRADAAAYAAKAAGRGRVCHEIDRAAA